jgi:DNA-binding transcriptional LysR family regulator
MSSGYVQYVRHGHSMLPLVDAGLGLALIPGSLRRMRYVGVVWRPILLPEDVAVDTHMAWRLNDDRDNPVVSETRRFVLEAAACEALQEIGTKALPKLPSQPAQG